jgi:hypothetical protein
MEENREKQEIDRESLRGAYPVWKWPFGIFYAPQRVFAAPTKRHEWVVPLAVFLVLFFGVNAAVLYQLGPESLSRLYTETFHPSKLLPDEKVLERARAIAEAPVPVIALQSTAFYLLLLLFYSFLLYKGVSLAGGKAPFPAMLAMASTIALVRVLKTLIVAVLVYARPESQTLDPLHSNFGLILGGRFEGFIPDALESIDFFTLWMAVLAAVGCRILGRIKTVHALAVAGAAWLISFLYSLLCVIIVKGGV